MAQPHTTTHDHADHRGHISYKGYIAIAVALTIFTLIEVWFGSEGFNHLVSGMVGSPGTTRFIVVASLLLVAAVKAVLVAAYYMHVLYESRVLIAVLLVPLLLALLFGLILAFQ